MTFSQLNLSNLNGSNGFLLNGIAAGDLSGNSVSRAGDINGDGIDDLLIGADGADPSESHLDTNSAPEALTEPRAALFIRQQGFLKSCDLLRIPVTADRTRPFQLCFQAVTPMPMHDRIADFKTAGLAQPLLNLNIAVKAIHLLQASLQLLVNLV
jgi:FG-GAP repeat